MKAFASLQIDLRGAKGCMQQANPLHLFPPTLQTSLMQKPFAGCQTRSEFPFRLISCLGGLSAPQQVFNPGRCKSAQLQLEQWWFTPLAVPALSALLLRGSAALPRELSLWTPWRQTRRGGLREILIKVPFTDALHQFISKCYFAN